MFILAAGPGSLGVRLEEGLLPGDGGGVGTLLPGLALDHAPGGELLRVGLQGRELLGLGHDRVQRRAHVLRVDKGGAAELREDEPRQEGKLGQAVQRDPAGGEVAEEESGYRILALTARTDVSKSKNVAVGGRDQMGAGCEWRTHQRRTGHTNFSTVAYVKYTTQ